ncbi:MAG: glucose-6-phosphate isomerase [Firmicutes bacterium]|jgi:glucose-6-phosphate isomerase|nr:glucose-6-phosphate isomerase [Bacillota bacterium]
MLKINLENSFVNTSEIKNMEPFIQSAHRVLHEGTGPGNDFIGWLDFASRIPNEEISRIKATAKKIQGNCEYFIVIGIGGSYLGAKSVIDALSHSFHNLLEDDQRKVPKIIYAGQNISGKYLRELTELIEKKDVSLLVISKSGTTTEPALSFRVLKEMVENKYGEESKDHIFAVTDGSKGALRQLADKESYESFVIPDNVGGRYSVITPVGLLPLAVMGINIEDFINGFVQGEKDYSSVNIEDNICYQYVAARNVLYRRNNNIELLVNYEPSLQYVSEWWKQLFGESEGKDGKGIFPGSVNFSTDLHSMGQFIQDGTKNLFETVIMVSDTAKDVAIKSNEENLDGLNYLSGKTLNYVNQKAFEGTLLAHVEGNVPNIILQMDKLDEYHLGNLMYFFMKACGVSGYLLGVNPFNQPGVEAYKTNMFRLLEKPGY